MSHCWKQAVKCGPYLQSCTLYCVSLMSKILPVADVNRRCRRSCVAITALDTWCCVCCRFEREQALVREELARLARREKEAGGDDLNPAVLREKARTREELEKAQNLVRQSHIQTVH